MGCLVKGFVVVDAEWRTSTAEGYGWNCTGAADLRGEETRRNTRENDQGREAMEIRHTYANGITGDFGIVPVDRESDRGCAQDAEIIGVVRVFPNVITADNRILAKRLL